MSLESLGADLRAEFGDALSPGVPTRALMLVSETGELAKEVLKATRYGAADFRATDPFCEELGDVLVDLALLAHAAGVSLGVCADVSVQKMRARLREQGHVGSETA